MNLKFHLGMSLVVLGIILFIFAEEAVETYEGSGEVEYSYDDRDHMKQLRESEY